MNNIFKKLFPGSVVVLLSITTSCSFDKMFYRPDKIPAQTSLINVTNPNSHDTIAIHFDDAHKPSFTKNHELYAPGYSIEGVTIKSKSGNEINGWFLKPEHATTTLLFIHGNGSNLIGQYPLISPLAAKGFQVFMFDYSGYGFSTGKPTQDNTLKDAMSALEYVKNRDDVKHTKLVIYGQSLGGHLSAVVAEREQSKVDALVTEGAFSSRKDIAAHMARRMFVPGFLGRALVNQHYAAKRSIRKFHKPILIIHSIEDETIPFNMGKTLYANANAPKSFYAIKGAHVRGVQLYADSIAERISNMLK